MTTTNSPVDPVEIMLDSEKKYTGSIVTLRVDQVRLPSGKTSHREVITHPGGAVVVPILPNGNLLLIKQFRYALGQMLLEFPAGKLDPGEGPAVTVKRELEEETGYASDAWEELTTIYTSPGFCDEKITIFKASDIRLSENPRRDEDEWIALIEMTPQAVLAQIRNKTIMDAKTICAFFLVYPGGVA